MTSIEYLAGFFDGEGCICIRKIRDCYSIACHIECTDGDCLIEFSNRFGGTIFKRKPRPYGFGRKTMWRWNRYGKNASELLRSLLPYLIAKKEEAICALEFAANRDSLNTLEKELYKCDLHNLKRRENLLSEMRSTS